MSFLTANYRAALNAAIALWLRVERAGRGESDRGRYENMSIKPIRQRIAIALLLPLTRAGGYPPYRRI